MPTPNLMVQEQNCSCISPPSRWGCRSQDQTRNLKLSSAITSTGLLSRVWRKGEKTLFWLERWVGRAENYKAAEQKFKQTSAGHKIRWQQITDSTYRQSRRWLEYQKPHYSASCPKNINMQSLSDMWVLRLLTPTCSCSRQILQISLHGTWPPIKQRCSTSSV